VLRLLLLLGRAAVHNQQVLLDKPVGKHLGKAAALLLLLLLLGWASRGNLLALLLLLLQAALPRLLGRQPLSGLVPHLLQLLAPVPPLAERAGWQRALQPGLPPASPVSALP
jgi:hypothetical protein